MRIAGIDPGKRGAVAVIDPAIEGLLSVLDLPLVTDGGSAASPREELDCRQIAIWMRATGSIDRVFIERASPMPSTDGESRPKGSVGAFNYGRADGMLHAVCVMMNWERVLITPQTWKKYFGLVGPNKDNSRNLAMQKFPKAQWLFKRVKDHQRAEAALIALYGWELMMRDSDDRADRTAATNSKTT